MVWKIKIARVFLAAYIGLCGAQVAYADDSQVVQDKLKIIYHFMSHFTSWPTAVPLDADGKVHLCSVGDDDVTKELHFLENASTRALQILVESNVDIEGLTRCDILYIADNSPYSMTAILKHIDANPVLSISAQTGFAEGGGMVELVREQYEQRGVAKRSVRYNVNATAIRKVKLRVKPEAYELAVRVYR